MKKISTILLAVIFFAAACVGAYFIFFHSNETPLSDFEYSLSESGESIIIDKYIGNAKEVVFPKEIDGLPVSIAPGVLGENSQVESITLPDDIVGLMNRTFYNCKNLRTVKFGSGTKYILTEVFKGCSSLEKVELPSGLINLGSYSFSECENLKEIVLPDSLEDVDAVPFLRSPVSKVTFEEGTKSICSYACYEMGADLTSVTIPATVEEMGKNCFGRHLKEIHFEGDAPNFTSDTPFDKNTVVYYDKDTSGWDTPILSEYTLIAE